MDREAWQATVHGIAKKEKKISHNLAIDNNKY